MRKIFLSFCVILIASILWIYHVNTNTNLVISRLSEKIIAQSDGELEYRVFAFGVVPAASAFFYPEETKDYKGRRLSHLQAKAKTISAISKFFTAEADLDSYLNPADNNPVIFLQKIKIKDEPEVNKEITYDQKKGIMVLAGVQRYILADTQDFLSAVYKIRNMDLDNIRNFEMSLNTNQKNYVLKTTVSQKTVLIARKTYKLFILDGQIQRRDKNNPYHRTKINMTLVKSKNNIPVLIKVSASGFPITAKLADIK